MTLVRRAVDGDDLPVGDQLGDPAAGDHEDQRGDDRLDPDDRDQEAVPQAEQQRQRKRERATAISTAPTLFWSSARLM